MIGKMYACIWHTHIEEFDWRMDYNGDGYVTSEEFNRAFADQTPFAIYEDYWNDWLTAGLSDDVELDFGHINELNNTLSNVMVDWNNTIAENEIEMVDDTISQEDAFNYFDQTASTLNAEVFTWAAYCMQRLDVRVVCFDRLTLELEAYDLNGDGGVDWDEFLEAVKYDSMMDVEKRI